MTEQETRGKPGLIIFDCDGVLIDSELLSADALIAELRDEGLDIGLDYFFAHCIGRNFATVATLITRDHGLELPVGFEERYRHRLFARFEKELQPVAGAIGLMSRLAIPFCVATSSSTERAGAALSITGISDLVEGRVFTSSMVKRAKPAPDLFLLAAKRNEVNSAGCLVIEDSEMGLQAARAAGMAVWRFTGGSHYAAGYRRHMDGSAADRDIAHFGEALALLEGLGALKPTLAA